MEGCPKQVAAVSAEEKPYTRIKFDRSRSGSREPQSGSEDRYKSNPFFYRSPSPYTTRYSRDNRERPIQTNNNRFGDDWRNNSQSNFKIIDSNQLRDVLFTAITVNRTSINSSARDLIQPTEILKKKE